MNHNLQSFEVNGSDPYFTADKWNETLSYSKCFEKMICSILGNKFKGIYKPFNNYELYDYVWLNDDYYQIIEEKANAVNVFQKDNYKNFYYIDDNEYLAINDKNKIVKIIGQNEYEINDLTFEKFYFFENNLIALRNQNLYKINLDEKKLIPFNYIFTRQIKDIKSDKFSIYIVSNNIIEKANVLNEDLTETKKIFETNKVIIDIAINNDNIAILLDDNSVEVINKSSGRNVCTFNIAQELNHEKSKITFSDDFSLFVYDGISKVLTFFNNGTTYLYSGNFENEYTKHGVSELTYNNSHISASNNAGVTTYLSSRYNLEKIDISSLLLNKTNIEKINAEEYLDFSKGQFETDFLKPEYTELSVINNKGIQVTKNISYNLKSLLNKTIEIIFNCDKALNENIMTVHIEDKLCNIPINVEPGEYKMFLDFYNDHFITSLFSSKNKILSRQTYSTDVNKNKIIFSSTTGYMLKSFIIFKNILKISEKDLLNQNTISSFDIQSSVKSYPFSYVKTDEDGNININIVDKSILKDKKGYKVNLSDKLTDSNTDVGLNLKGAKTLWDKVVSEVNRLTNSLAPKSHRHEWQEIDNVPSATTSNKGIVQLSNSVTGTSEEKAATESAVKITYDKANHGHPYLNIENGGTVKNEVIISDGSSPSNTGGLSIGYTGSDGRFIKGANITPNGEISANALNSKKILIDGYTITIG